MPIPSLITDLSTTASSNSPSGSDSPIDGDNFIRALSAFIAQLYSSTVGLLGVTTAVGVSGGNGTVQCTITPPVGTRTIDIFVDGNYFNATPNSHIGVLISRYTAVNGNVRASTDINHSSGSNQGFIATWTGSAIQITNKSAMSFTQSGDTRCVFWA